jgi:subtilisin family serine protease
MVRRSFIYILVSCLLVTVPLSAAAGQLSLSLEQAIAGKSANEFVRVIIIPFADQNSFSLKATVTGQYATRVEQHRAAMQILHSAAERTQAPVRAELASLEKTGRVRQIRSYWITNLIEAEVTIEALPALAEQPAIEAIDMYPAVTSIPSEAVLSPSRIGPGLVQTLKIIKADSAWAAGYDGRGRIVCGFDSGVDGLHPALSGNYHGNKGYPAGQCWYSGVDSSDYPHPFSSAGVSTPHGTHTTGIMVGHDDAAGDTIGVAPGADWISAVAIDVPGSSIFASFQWAADPDGNPNTVSDVPDVINHSWGVPGIGCADLFWDIVDNMEALGIVNIFGAGNEGPGARSIRNPADRAADSITNFAVGSIQTDGVTISKTSSRGPSDCDSVSIKPNVVAPGDSIVSAVPDGRYAAFNGTSMAAPHVSGAVAILRQKNPDATVDQIKTALLTSCRDLGSAGPDNNYGWGAIDIMEALRRIPEPQAPALQIAELSYPEINPGDMIDLNLAVKNVGTTASDVIALFSNPDDGMVVLTDQMAFGIIDQDAVAYGAPALKLIFDPSAEPGRFYALDMTLHSGGGYVKQHRLSFLVGPRGEKSYFHHTTGRVRFTVSNYGAFGFHGTTDANAFYGSFIPLGFDGYTFDRDTNDLFEAALLIGTDPHHVSDCARNIAQEPDNDFVVVPGGSVTASVPGRYADQETVSSFDDSFAENPLGLVVEQRTYSWSTAPDNTFIILKYVITNASPNTVNGVRIGLFLDWDIRNFAQNHGSFVPRDDIGYMCWASGGDSADFRGVKVLNRQGLINHRMYLNPLEIYGSRFTEFRKYQGLADNSSGSLSTFSDESHVTATGPFNLPAGKSDTAAFAIIGGATWEAFMEAVARAEQKYGDLPTDADDHAGAALPQRFSVGQNRPNPFNPSTTLPFATPRAGRVQVDIFDILGRSVKSVLDADLPAGEHAVVWDGRSASDAPAASGVYFYRVRFDGTAVARKMLLIK